MTPINSSDQPLDPWMRGPLELIRHANGHYKAGGDTDRRIALIGFDNSVEVCIDVFLTLHPRLRHGLKISPEETNKARQNFHSKLEFLDRHIAGQNRQLDVSVEAILWYHLLRNELYHSGNGMVPEMHVIEGARVAAVCVFEALFQVPVGSQLIADFPSPTPDPQLHLLLPGGNRNDEMEFLSGFIEFERTLRIFVATASRARGAGRNGVLLMWQTAMQAVPELAKWNGDVRRATEIRNQLVHGEFINDPDEGLEGLLITLTELMEYLDSVQR